MDELATALYEMCMVAIGRVRPNGSVYDFYNFHFRGKTLPGAAAMAEAMKRAPILKGHAKAALKEKNRNNGCISGVFAKRSYPFVAEIFAKEGWKEFGSLAENRFGFRTGGCSAYYGIPHEYQDGPGPSSFILHKLWE